MLGRRRVLALERCLPRRRGTGWSTGATGRASTGARGTSTRGSRTFIPWSRSSLTRRPMRHRRLSGGRAAPLPLSAANHPARVLITRAPLRRRRPPPRNPLADKARRSADCSSCPAARRACAHTAAHRAVSLGPTVARRPRRSASAKRAQPSATFPPSRAVPCSTTETSRAAVARRSAPSRTRDSPSPSAGSTSTTGGGGRCAPPLPSPETI